MEQLRYISCRQEGDHQEADMRQKFIQKDGGKRANTKKTTCNLLHKCTSDNLLHVHFMLCFYSTFPEY